ncbi:MAG: DUF177 domain-containing protein [Verrucomicrobiota bacterium]
MSVTINLRHLEKQNLQLEGEVSPAELGLEAMDECIRVTQSLKYDLEVQKLEESLLLQGSLVLLLDCECVRCLKPLVFRLELDPWSCLIPLSGEEAVKIISDEVDLTPFIREDIILGFPQHPLCEAECGGLKSLADKTQASGTGGFDQGSSPWNALNKLKL